VSTSPETVPAAARRVGAGVDRAVADELPCAFPSREVARTAAPLRGLAHVGTTIPPDAHGAVRLAWETRS